MSNDRVQQVLSELELGQVGADGLGVSRRQALAALASVGALGSVGTATADDPVGGVIAEEAFLWNFGSEFGGETNAITIDGDSYEFLEDEILLPDGSTGEEILLPNGAEVSEVIAPNGETVWEGFAIPDSGMFQSPIYQWWGVEIDAADGTSPVDWPESLANLADATAVGGPSKQTQDGFEAAQYDGADDGHDWTSDSQIPTGDNAYTIAALVYVSSVKDHEVTGYGNATDSEACRLAVTDENGDLKVRGANWVNDLTGATTVSTGQWHTIGHSYDGGSIREVFLDGARDAADDPGTLNIQDQNHTIGYRLDGAAGWYVDGFVAEILYASAYNGEQAFGDYHQDRLG